MPDDPKVVVQYVGLFLPGFLVLGAISHATDLVLTEFAFVYIAVALSLAIYVLGSLFYRWWSRWWRSGTDLGSSDATSSVQPVPLLAVGVAALLVFLILVTAAENQWGLKGMRAAGLKLERASTRPLLPYLFAPDGGHLSLDIDGRPTSMWVRCDPQARDKCAKYIYDAYARVSLGGEVFEGFVRRYTMDANSKGLPFLLAPACRVKGTSPSETVTLVPGPGVVVFSEKLEWIEMRESCASACYRQIQPEECGVVR